MHTESIQSQQIQNQQQMLAQRQMNQQFEGKEGLLQSSVLRLRQQLAEAEKEKEQIQHSAKQEVNRLKIELGECKKKLAAVTEKYLRDSLNSDRQGEERAELEKARQQVREKEMVVESLRAELVRKQEDSRRLGEDLNKAKKEVMVIKAEKEKVLEMGVMEKIELEDKVRLCQEEIKSKKGLLSGLKKELQKAYQYQEDITRRQRAITQKSRQLEAYSSEVGEVKRAAEVKLKHKVSLLNKQNAFLREYVGRLEEAAKKECCCDSKEQETRQNLFSIKRELAVAKAKLAHKHAPKTRNNSAALVFSPSPEGRPSP